jgi:proline iminopeptidase
MKNLIRFGVVSSLILSVGLLARAQDSSTRAEFECLMMTTTKGRPMAGEKERVPTYHQVWVPDMVYGKFQSNGLDLVYDMEGNGDETVIVVHGGPGLPHEYFHPLLSTLGRYMKLVYFDRRADILSAQAAHEVAPIREMADDIDALRQALGLKRVTLLAHSFGGAIALNYALSHPDNVKRLILVNTAGAIESPAETEKRLVKMLSPAEMAAYRSNEGVPAPATPCERVRKRYRALYPHYFRRPPNDYWLDFGVYSAYFDSLAKKQALASDAAGSDLRAELDKIKVPVLVVGGRYDLVTPLDQVGEMAKGLPLARMVVMEHSGHFPFIEENYVFTEWVRKFIAATNDTSDDKAVTSAAAASTGSSR